MDSGVMCYGQEIDRQTVLCYHQDVAVAGMARRNHHWRNNLPFWLSGESGYTTSASICLCLCRSVNMFWEISFGLVAEGECGIKRNFRSFSFHRVVDGRKKVWLKAGLFCGKIQPWPKVILKDATESDYLISFPSSTIVLCLRESMLIQVLLL